MFAKLNLKLNPKLNLYLTLVIEIRSPLKEMADSKDDKNGVWTTWTAHGTMERENPQKTMATEISTMEQLKENGISHKFIGNWEFKLLIP